MGTYASQYEEALWLIGWLAVVVAVAMVFYSISEWVFAKLDEQAYEATERGLVQGPAQDELEDDDGVE